MPEPRLKDLLVERIREHIDFLQRYEEALLILDNIYTDTIIDGKLSDNTRMTLEDFLQRSGNG